MSGTIVLILRILAAGALYAFIGWALYTLWKDLRSIPSTIDPLPTLEITQPGSETGPRTFNLPVITIGRSENCILRLPDSSISSHHARMSHHHQQWWLEDLDSTNGTQLNGAPITAPVVVIDGDIVQCGSVTLQIHIKPDEALT
jgi:pSer/pThr/pTyr-binding forkhead associated (FHA) protein